MPKRSKVYDPKQVQYWRDRAKLGVPILKQPLADRIGYRCKACGAEFMGNEQHTCDNSRR